MISDSASTRRRSGGWGSVAARVAADGSAAHPHVAALLSARAAPRDLADAVHAICTVHGNASERFHEAMTHPSGIAHHDWLAAVGDGFAGERSYLSAIVAAAGPLPSTPGQAQTEQAFAAARHAFHMLAIADRHGCVLGAAAARFGVARADGTLPDDADLAHEVAREITTPATERAMMFGVDQVLAQHRALWDVLAARAGAREAH